MLFGDISRYPRPPDPVAWTDKEWTQLEGVYAAGPDEAVEVKSELLGFSCVNPQPRPVKIVHDSSGSVTALRFSIREGAYREYRKQG